MIVENPLRNIQLKIWPDFLMAAAGFLLVISVIISLLAGSQLSGSCALLFGGGFLFGIGGKLAHYRYRDPNVKGNSNAWFAGWRHGPLADTFAGIGLILIVAAIFSFHEIFYA